MKFTTALIASAVSLASSAFAIPASTTAAAAQPSETLGWGQHWIKTSDNLFLQSQTAWTPGPATLGSADTAGEFNIVSTSLCDTVHTPEFLYGIVESITPGATQLQLTFEAGILGPASGGVFAWTTSGDDQLLSWSRSDSAFTGWILCDNIIYANQISTVPDDCSSIELASNIGTFA
ncbi:hypothetical protein Clacol_008334 [Clathrus columnatus]|uniref:Uncharacterized protein n=1 Tax=Clathrus columnatus TaxID=1419009 RepID=A0AAV5AJZ3_9AGAM|nr:hypothetical protein Clacol_008334 [Clathrus columnatus]